MGLTTRALQAKALTQKDLPHVYEVRDTSGNRYVHCGTMKDVESILSIHSDFTYEKIYLPEPPQTVDVSSVTMTPDPQLSEQRTLPQSELQELFS